MPPLCSHRRHRVVSNRRRRPNPLRIDPTRSGGLRRQLTSELRKRFAVIKRKILELVRDEDAFGLLETERSPIVGNLLEMYCGGEGGKPGPCPEGGGESDKPPEAQGRLGRIASAIKGKVVAAYDKFSARYGTKGAIAMIAAIAVTFPIPGNILAVIGAAEAIKAAGKLVGHQAPNLEQMLADLEQLIGEPIDEAERVKLRGALISSLKTPAVNVHNQRFAFMSTPEQLKAFQAWLGKLLASELVGRTEDDLWRKYVEEGFKKGQGRAWDDFKRRSDPEYIGKTEDFYMGSRGEFLRSAFARPVAVEKVKLMASRVFTELRGITESMATGISRALTDGLVQGQHPREIARGMADQVDISRARAERIARTEMIRVHAEGQLQALEDLGVTEVGVEVEWTTAQDSAVCPRCVDMENVVLAVEDATGLIPLHPNCRCAWLPASVGEDEEDQLRGRGAQRAMRRADASWRGGSRLVYNQKLMRLVSMLPERDRAFRQLLLNCGGKGGKPGPCPEGGGEETSTSPMKFSEGEVIAAKERLAAMPEAEEGYRHFDDQEGGGPPQIRMKDAGFAGIGTPYLQPANPDKVAKVMALDPSKVKYIQSSVTRHGVEGKLVGETSEFQAKEGELPLVVKDGDEYHLQDGNHRAVAQVLARGTFAARVIERVSKGKYKTPG